MSSPYAGFSFPSRLSTPPQNLLLTISLLLSFPPLYSSSSAGQDHTSLTSSPSSTGREALGASQCATPPSFQGQLTAGVEPTTIGACALFLQHHSPTAPRPSLSATLIAMKFALERSVGCNFGRDRCNLGRLGCLGGDRWRPERVIQVDLLQTNSLPVPHPATASP